MKKSNYVLGMNRETYKVLFSNEVNKKIEDYQQNDLENLVALDTIDFYSRYQEKKIFKLLIKLCNRFRNIDFNRISYNPYSEEYEYDDRKNNIFVTFSMLSDYTNDNETKELLSTKRYHICHKRSILYSQKVKDSKVLTGFVYLNSYKYLHSVLEYNENGIPHIIDWTKDAIMTKNDYMKLTKFKVVSTLDSNQIRKDLKTFQTIFDGSQKSDNGLYKLYATFGEEIMEDLDRNKQLLKK